MILSASIHKTLLLILVQSGNLFSVIGVSAYIGHVRTAEELSVVLFGFSLVATLTTITDISYNQHGIRYALLHEKKDVVTFLVDYLLIKILIFLPIVIFMEIAANLLFDDPSSIIFVRISVLASLLSSLIPAWQYQASSSMYIWALSSTVGRVGFFLLTILQGLEISIIWVAVFNAIGYLFPLAICLVPQWSSIRNSNCSTRRLRKRLKIQFKLTNTRFFYPPAMFMPQAFLAASIGLSPSYASFLALDQLYKAASAALTPIYQSLYIARSSDRNLQLAVRLLPYLAILIVPGLLFGGPILIYLIDNVYNIQGTESEVVILFAPIFVILPISFYLRGVFIPVFASIAKSNQIIGTQALSVLVMMSALYLASSVSVRNVAVCLLLSESLVFFLRFIASYKLYKAAKTMELY